MTIMESLWVISDAFGSWGLDEPGSIPGNVRFFCSLQREDLLWVHPASYPMRAGGKAARA
jgi:hypothetical protein